MDIPNATFIRRDFESLLRVSENGLAGELVSAFSGGRNPLGKDVQWDGLKLAQKDCEAIKFKLLAGDKTVAYATFVPFPDSEIVS